MVNFISEKTVVSLHWLTLVYVIAMLIMAAIASWEIQKLKDKPLDPDARNAALSLNIALSVLLGLLLIPLIWWAWKMAASSWKNGTKIIEPDYRKNPNSMFED